jgi:hypothetical protein
MRGSDCTQDQLDHASAFLDGRGWPTGADSGVSTRADIVRLIAWYGALRFKAARDGEGGSMESPGALYTPVPSLRPEAGVEASSAGSPLNLSPNGDRS